MKILYIEDEVEKLAVGKFSKLFKKFIDKELEEKIENLRIESQENSYPIDPEKFKSIVEETNIIEYEYNFYNALKKIVKNYEKYSLFIVDRNLLGNPSSPAYERTKVESLHIEYPAFNYEKYKEKEGDYLFHYLFCQMGMKVLDKFYFLTAYSSDIINSSNYQLFIDMKVLKSENFILKEDEKEKKFIQEVIENIDVLDLLNQDKEYIRILKKLSNSKNAFENVFNFYLELLKNIDNPNESSANLWRIRVIFENILYDLHNIFNRPENVLGGKDGDAYLKYSPFIKWIISNKINDFYIENIFENIYHSLSHAVHKKFENPEKISTNVVNAHFYQLKEIIHWYGNL